MNKNLSSHPPVAMIIKVFDIDELVDVEELQLTAHLGHHLLHRGGRLPLLCTFGRLVAFLLSQPSNLLQRFYHLVNYYIFVYEFFH